MNMKTTSFTGRNVIRDKNALPTSNSQCTMLVRKVLNIIFFNQIPESRIRCLARNFDILQQVIQVTKYFFMI